ncbi:MAG: NAD-binding of NADP-dependent 3-hydroxyisobutyrate dehydrogenase family protein [Hydrocarboniphaga sp.]|uniref:NAD(P)-dependent oxidoreductase n=1 Tax=Hydrocarboniphaga sp. TaxID=2033016 RepID=UPI002622D8BB|nr:NAD(P)-dependent oxidoreductase [Hydrocarboniphaga sp.]MDB5968667.1 NAD-binding of NADP-dependent 3-hydroxyisobutyrate dehydrogenase family protein [Hydrocarboniphaga sp.]
MSDRERKQERKQERSMKCGFIGLGSQGGSMARRMIDAGYPVTLWARRPESLQPYADTSAKTAASIAELGAQAEHVGICVVDDAGVQQVCDELIPAMQPGGCIVIHSTVHPQRCIKLAEQAAARGLALIDAPVSGGGGGAAAGTLTVMVGGDKAAVEAARPVFETFAGLIVHLGGVGAGQIAKLVNNAMMAANLAVAHFGLAAGTTLGVDRKELAELIKVSSGRSYGFEVYARLPTPSAFAHGAKLLAKDLRLLGETMGDDPSFKAFRDLTMPVLELALKP